MNGMTVKFMFKLGEVVVDESPLATGKVSIDGRSGKIVSATITEKGVFYSIKSNTERQFQAKEEALTPFSEWQKNEAKIANGSNS